MLRDSVVPVVVAVADAVVVVLTRPRAIPLVMITMRKSTYGFPFLSYMSMGLRLAALLAAGAPLEKNTGVLFYAHKSSPSTFPQIANHIVLLSKLTPNWLWKYFRYLTILICIVGYILTCLISCIPLIPSDRPKATKNRSKSNFRFIVMQMRKVNREKNYCQPKIAQWKKCYRKFV